MNSERESLDEKYINDILWQLEINKEQVSKLKILIKNLYARTIMLFFVSLVLGLVLIASASMHFLREYGQFREEYEVILGAASIFGFFFLYESVAAALGAYSRWQHGKRLWSNQVRLIQNAEHLVYDESAL